MLNLFSASQSEFGYGRDHYEAWARQKALRLFDDALMRGRLRRMWSRLRRQPYQLFSLAEFQTAGSYGTTYYAGFQTVTLDQIRGSQERSHDFDDAFFPYQEHIKERWVRVAMARQLGISLPPISLVRVGGLYFVEDGHHRISVARVLGQQQIEAEVKVLSGKSERLAKTLSRKSRLLEKAGFLRGPGDGPSLRNFGWPRIGAAQIY